MRIVVVKCFVNTKNALDNCKNHDYSMGTIQDSKAVTKKACDIPDLQRAVSAEIRCYGNRKWLSLPSRYPQREFPSRRYPLHRVKAEELSDFVKWRFLAQVEWYRGLFASTSKQDVGAFLFLTVKEKAYVNKQRRQR